jgi:hypothetical protein
MRIIAGTAAALGAATLFGLGIVLQAGAARAAPAGDTLRVRLLVRLMQSPRWLAGAALTVAGWGLQAAALLLAPVTLVQPALAFTVVVVLALAAPILRESVGGREVLAGCAIAAGIGVVAVVTPARSSEHAGGVALLVTLVLLAAVAVFPLATRGSAHSIRALPLAAGTAFALSSIATKLLTDAGRGSLPAGAAWLAVTALAAAVGGIDEMSAFRVRRAVAVVPVVLAVETLLPVVLAPALLGEHWGTSAPRQALLALALAVVTAGVFVLGRSRPVAVSFDALATPARPLG